MSLNVLNLRDPVKVRTADFWTNFYLILMCQNYMTKFRPGSFVYTDVQRIHP